MNNTLFFDAVPEMLVPYFDGKGGVWEPLNHIAAMIRDITGDGGYRETGPGVFVGKGVEIARGAVVYGPAIIGDYSEIRPGAFIRGCVIICRGCVIGNSTEIKNSILFENAQAPHFNYVGDSILGNFSHLGAGAVLSNFRFDEKPVDIIMSDKTKLSTGRKKLGAVIGDRCLIGCNSVLNPGTILEKGIWVYPQSNIGGGYYKAGHRFANNRTGFL
jgi:NDP-sugar pyrophosphorylase family protein